MADHGEEKKKIRHSYASICYLLQGKSKQHAIIPGLYYHGLYENRPEKIAGILIPIGYEEDADEPLVYSTVYLINGVMLPEYYVIRHPELKEYLIKT